MLIEIFYPLLGKAQEIDNLSLVRYLL